MARYEKILFATLFLLCVSSFAQYSYKGKAISETKFNELFSNYSKFFFAYKDEIYDLMDSEGKLKSFDGKSGVLSGSVTVAYKKDKEAFVLSPYSVPVYNEKVIARSDSVSRIGGSIGGNNAQTVRTLSHITGDNKCLLINILPEDYEEEISVPALRLDKVKENHSNSLDEGVTLATRILPATKEQFEKYITAGGLLYKIEKSNDIYAACNTCGGSGKIKNPKYNRNRMDSKEKIACATCNGSGKTLSSSGKNIKVEVQ